MGTISLRSETRKVYAIESLGNLAGGGYGAQRLVDSSGEDVSGRSIEGIADMLRYFAGRHQHDIEADVARGIAGVMD